jgi:cytochrome c oxidase subunit 2
MSPFPGLPPDGAAHGPEIDRLMAILHVFMAVLFTVWFAYFVATLVRYRSSKRPSASYKGPRGLFLASTVALVFIVEIVLDIFFSVPIWSKRSSEFPDPKDATVVRIVAEQFAWNVHYPGPDGLFGRTSADLVESFNPLGLDRNDPAGRDDITLLNQVVVPAGKPVIVYLTSKDVIHSLNIPVYRIKQDAVPGLMSPVWFVPEKTTARIREEMATAFSVVKAVSTRRTLELPRVETIEVTGGTAPAGYLAAADVPDTAGSTLLSSGDDLDDARIAPLAAAGITTVRARRKANLDMYIAVKEYAGRSGVPLLAANGSLTEDAVTTLVNEGITGVDARRLSHTDPWIVRSAIVAPGGDTLAPAGTPLDEEIISAASAAGLGSIAVAPATPTEIGCAQLCGLGHYQMRGTIDVLEPAEFAKWMSEQEAALAGGQTEQQGTSQ